MLVDHENVFMTQRKYPQLSQIKISLTVESILVSYDGLSDLKIPLEYPKNPNVEVTVWNDQVSAVESPEPINEWFSKVVGESCKLVFMSEKSSRLVNPERALNGETVSFADGYPYLILGQSSLDDLNSRMEEDLPMNRFRPNIVVEGSQPYAEDNWKHIQIGNVKFYVSHTCKRCVFMTIDQETGKKGKEPLKTLATYRRQGNDVIFGVNTLAVSTGNIKVGDSVKLNS